MARLAALLTFVTLAATSQATTLEKLSLDDMIQKSNAIVRGKVVGSYAAFRGSMLFTHYRVEVAERLKGGLSGTIEVSVPGGMLGNVRQVIPGAPRMEAGAEYAIFVYTNRSGLNLVIGLCQGLFDLRANGAGDWILARPPAGVQMVDGAGQPTEDKPVEMSWRQLSGQIRTKVVEKQ